jgi:hypothetical protein
MVDRRQLGAEICTCAVCLGLAAECMIPISFLDCDGHGSPGICREYRQGVVLAEDTHAPTGTSTASTAFGTIAGIPTSTTLRFEPGIR